MNKKFKPIHDVVVIKKINQKSESSIIINIKHKKNKSGMGEVIDVGKGRHDLDGNFIPTSLKIGDIVYFPFYAGYEIKLLGNDYCLIEEEKILAFGV